MMKNSVFPADLAYLHAMLDLIKAFLNTVEMESDVKDKIVLASEEALVNIIKYGYPPDGKDGRVEIQCEKLVAQPGVKIVLKDHGIPFNPVEYVEPHPILIVDPNDLALGGLGISIFLSLMDRVEYQQIPGGNKLTLIKYTSPTS